MQPVAHLLFNHAACTRQVIYIVMAYMVMAYMVMAYIVMAYVVMA